MDEELMQHPCLPHTYIIGEPITREQFSTVYKCLFKGKIERACRVYNKKHVDKEKVLQINFITTLNHPNITHIFGGYENETELQVVCERLTGVELFERIVELGHYTEAQASKSVTAVLSALQYLHSNGVVHGDIRPESLIYQSSSEEALLKLSDVSFSRFASDTSAVIYLAPEYKEHTQTSQSEDVWSLGIVVYTMLCGLEPVASEDSNEDPTLHLAFLNELSAEAKHFVSKLLERDPEKRVTAEQALKESWITAPSKPNKHLNNTVSRLKELNARRKFKVATNAVMATKFMGDLTGLGQQVKDFHQSD